MILSLLLWALSWGAMHQDPLPGLYLHLALEYQRTEPHANQYFLPEQVEGKVLLKPDDFLGYDAETKTLLLSDSAKSSLNQLDISMTGLPMVMALDEQPLLGFWLVNGQNTWGISWWVGKRTSQGIKLVPGQPRSSFQANYEDGEWEQSLNKMFPRD
ncbi:MAG: hypothetical protein AAFQ98_06335 [Bacteroidota bacterium]